MVIGAGLKKCSLGFGENLVMLIELMKPEFSLINGIEVESSINK